MLKEEKTANAEKTENAYMVTFGKPYKFEDNEYKGIDLAGLAELTVDDLCAVQAQLERAGKPAMVLETNYETICAMAARATEQPVEFFKRLPITDGVKVKNVVSRCFFGV